MEFPFSYGGSAQLQKKAQSWRASSSFNTAIITHLCAYKTLQLTYREQLVWICGLIDVTFRHGAIEHRRQLIEILTSGKKKKKRKGLRKATTWGNKKKWKNEKRKFEPRTTSRNTHKSISIGLLQHIHTNTTNGDFQRGTLVPKETCKWLTHIRTKLTPQKITCKPPNIGSRCGCSRSSRDGARNKRICNSIASSISALE